MPNSNSEYLAEIRKQFKAVCEYDRDGPEVQVLILAVREILRYGPRDTDFGVCYNLSECRDAAGDAYFPVYDLLYVVSAIYPGDHLPGDSGYWLSVDPDANHWEGENRRARYAFLEWFLEVLESDDAGE